jgi:hypothetical protein
VPVHVGEVQVDVVPSGDAPVSGSQDRAPGEYEEQWLQSRARVEWLASRVRAEDFDD